MINLYEALYNTKFEFNQLSDINVEDSLSAINGKLSFDYLCDFIIKNNDRDFSTTFYKDNDGTVYHAYELYIANDKAEELDSFVKRYSHNNICNQSQPFIKDLDLQDIPLFLQNIKLYDKQKPCLIAFGVYINKKLHKQFISIECEVSQELHNRFWDFIKSYNNIDKIFNCKMDIPEETINKEGIYKGQYHLTIEINR